MIDGLPKTYLWGAAGMLFGSILVAAPSLRSGAEPRLDLATDFRDAPAPVAAAAARFPARAPAAHENRMLHFASGSSSADETAPTAGAPETEHSAALGPAPARWDPREPDETPPGDERPAHDGSAASLRAEGPARARPASDSASAAKGRALARLPTASANPAAFRRPAASPRASFLTSRRSFFATARPAAPLAGAGLQTSSADEAPGSFIGQSLSWTQGADEAAAAIAGGGGLMVLDGPAVPRPSDAAPAGAAPAAGARDVSRGASGFGSASRPGAAPATAPPKPVSPTTPLADLPAADEERKAPGSLLANRLDFARPQGKAEAFPGWSRGDRLSSCGLIAAEALQRVLSRNPELDRIDDIKRRAVEQRLWNASVGMYGIEAERKLIESLGMDVVKVSLWLNARADFDELRATMVNALGKGKPVIVSTTRHYFFVQGYADGKFFVGATGEILAAYGGRAWMTLDAIAASGATISGILIPQ
ncbi:MAG: hypothetical protein HY553_18460 [Elusimicrobia bacterium]|nr:hypothetical protein [Elusimicrobiota bacterium]